MRRHLAAVAGLAVFLTPAVASAQYYGDWPGYGRHREHVDVYRHGDHEDVVVRRHHHHDDFDRPARFEERRHHHHHDLDD